MNSKFGFLAASAIALVAATPAFAAPAVNLTTPGTEYGGSQYTLGFEFSVSGSQSINALGVYDNLGNGLASNASIGLWDLSGNLLTSTTILAGGGTLNGLFRYNSISPFALTAGTHYIIGAYTTDLATSLNAGQGGTGTINPLVTIYRDRFSNFNSLFSFPTETNSTPGGWLGANFNLVEGQPAVPEPATWLMMVVGFGAVGFAMRRRPKVATTFNFA